MIQRSWKTTTEEETIDLGRRLAAALVPPVWVGIDGPLGAGKTRLIQGMVDGLGYAGRVRSPTYVVENLYRGPTLVRHQDLYRLEGPDEEILAGWEDNEDAVVLVEWAARSEERPERALEIQILVTGVNDRTIRLEFAGDGGVRLEALPEDGVPA